jgi:GntR family transcriptional regulator
LSTTPRYLEIADQLRQAIIDGALPPGSKVDSASQLAERYDVAPATVREATSLLLREGLLTSTPGSGMFVREQPEIIRMVRSWYQRPGTGSPWRAAMADLGREGGWESSSEVCEAVPAVAERLQIAAGDAVMRTRYLYTVDGAPAFLATSWEPLALTRGTDIMLPEAGPHAGRGVRDRMELIGHKPTYCREENLARTLTADEAGRLKLHAGISILVVQRTYMHAELPVETADIVFPPHIRAVYELPVD